MSDILQRFLLKPASQRANSDHILPHEAETTSPLPDPTPKSTHPTETWTEWELSGTKEDAIFSNIVTAIGHQKFHGGEKKENPGRTRGTLSFCGRDQPTPIPPIGHMSLGELTHARRGSQRLEVASWGP